MPVTFGNDEEALQALQNSSTVADLSHWDRLHISGKDRLAFLHGQVRVFHPKTHSAQVSVALPAAAARLLVSPLQQRHAATP